MLFRSELLRQWSTLHPEFAHLPRKFKFAINGAKEDRTILLCHDVGIELKEDASGALVASIYAGGGMGRTPILGSLIKEDLPWQLLPSYLTALLRVYNRFGRRDNLYKARIKILVKALGPEEFARQVEGEWLHIKNGDDNFTQAEWDRVAKHFTKPAYKTLPALNNQQVIDLASDADKIAFRHWLERNVRSHQVPGYASVILSLKPHGSVAPGDATSAQMVAIADLADQFSFGELRATHEQNLVLADVEQSQLYKLWQEAKKQKVALPNVGLLTDIIACPGGDFCSLANAKSLPIAKAIQERFDDLDYLFDLGDISLNISGCINSCGHHHVDVQVISTIPVMFSYWAEPKDGLEIAKYLNDHIADVCHRYPARFVGLGTLPMQHTDLAIQELRRCKDIGLKGIQIGSHVNHMNLNDPSLFPIFEAMQELDMALFVHPWWYSANKKMQHYWLPWLVGMPWKRRWPFVR